VRVLPSAANVTREITVLLHLLKSPVGTNRRFDLAKLTSAIGGIADLTRIDRLSEEVTVAAGR
jgi:hypothetical protein